MSNSTLIFYLLFALTAIKGTNVISDQLEFRQIYVIIDLKLTDKLTSSYNRLPCQTNFLISAGVRSFHVPLNFGRIALSQNRPFQYVICLFNKSTRSIFCLPNVYLSFNLSCKSISSDISRIYYNMNILQPINTSSPVETRNSNMEPF